MSAKDGGPAFPPDAGSAADRYMGMSLRDWFAGRVIVGLLARGAQDTHEPLAMGLDVEAYRIADAMLAAREAP